MTDSQKVKAFAKKVGVDYKKLRPQIMSKIMPYLDKGDMAGAVKLFKKIDTGSSEWDGMDEASPTLAQKRQHKTNQRKRDQDFTNKVRRGKKPNFKNESYLDPNIGEMKTLLEMGRVAGERLVEAVAIPEETNTPQSITEGKKPKGGDSIMSKDKKMGKIVSIDGNTVMVKADDKTYKTGLKYLVWNPETNSWRDR